MADVLSLPTSAPDGCPRCALPSTDPASGSVAPPVVGLQDATAGGTIPPLTDLNAIVARLEAVVRSAAVRPLVVDSTGLAALLACSKRHIARMRSAGELPDAMTVGSGSKVVWRLADVELFVSVGCNRSAFDAVKRQRAK